MLVLYIVEGYVFVAVDETDEDVCPKRFVVETTKNRKRGVSTEVCSSKTGL